MYQAAGLAECTWSCFLGETKEGFIAAWSGVLSLARKLLRRRKLVILWTCRPYVSCGTALSVSG